MSFKIVTLTLAGGFKDYMKIKHAPIAAAATQAVAAAANDVKADGRADIAKAGFGKRWQNALRADVYPSRGNSINAAAWIYHKIHYAGVFESGARVAGKPLLWLPLPGAPKKLGGKKTTPQNFNRFVGPLFALKNSRVPLLAANVGLSESQAKRKKVKISLAGLKRGVSGEGSKRAVPMFVGVSAINIRKKFSIIAICKAAAAKLPGLYARYFKDDG